MKNEQAGQTPERKGVRRVNNKTKEAFPDYQNNQSKEGGSLTTLA